MKMVTTYRILVFFLVTPVVYAVKNIYVPIPWQVMTTIIRVCRGIARNDR